MDPLVAESLDMACPEPGSPDVNEVEGFVAALFEKEQREGVERYLDAIATERQRVHLVVADMVASPVNYISSLPDEGGFRDRMTKIVIKWSNSIFSLRLRLKTNFYHSIPKPSLIGQ